MEAYPIMYTLLQIYQNSKDTWNIIRILPVIGHIQYPPYHDVKGP